MSDEFDDIMEPLYRHRGSNAVETTHDRAAITAPRLISRLYASASQPLRAKLLAYLVRPLGLLGLAAVAAGAFAVLLRRGSPGNITVAIDDVARYSNQQVLELASFVEQVSPETLQQVATLISDNPVGIAAFSASAAFLLVRVLQRKAR